MSPAEIIGQATADGLRLALSPSGSISAKGARPTVARWLPAIRQSKAAIIAALQEAANVPEPACDPALSVEPMTVEEETAIRAWLALIEEADLAIIGDVIERCRTDPDALAYYLGRAAEARPAPDPPPSVRNAAWQARRQAWIEAIWQPVASDSTASMLTGSL